MTNTTAWLLWSGFTISLLLSTRNPFYLMSVITSQFILGTVIAKNKGQALWLSGNLRFLLTMVGISTFINTLFVHNGRTVIVTLPENWLLIGGHLTVESLVAGVINGLIIGALYLTFNILNLALSIKQMTRLIPGALKPIAMTITVALTFFPSVQQRGREIKEAQMIRGNPMKRVVDWLPLIIPLLVTSLEKAFLLAESMTARGFHIERADFSSQGLLIGMILGTFAIFSGWILRLFDYPLMVSIILYLLGGIVFVMGFWHSGRKVASSRYHRETWSWQDIASSVLFLLTTFVLLLLRMSPLLHSLNYSPYPTIEAPGFQFLAVILGTLPAMPVLLNHYD